MEDKISDFLDLPLPDDVRKAIQEILKEQGAKDELVCMGILELMKRKGGEIRVMNKQTLPELDIRRGVEDDAKALSELADVLEVEGFTGPNSIKALKGGQKWIHGFAKDDRVHNKEHPRKWIYFAFDGDRLVGNVNGFELVKKEEIEESKAIYHLPDKRVGYVGIHVHPDYREKGVGEALMQRAIQEAKELGVEVLTINTWIKSMPTIRLAEKMGFKEHMQLKKGYEVGYGRVLKEPMVFMTMDIQ